MAEERQRSREDARARAAANREARRRERLAKGEAGRGASSATAKPSCPAFTLEDVCIALGLNVSAVRAVAERLALREVPTALAA